MKSLKDKPLVYIGKRVIIRTLDTADAPLLHSWMQEKFFYYYKPYLKKVCSTASLLAQRIVAQSSLNQPFEIEALVLHRPSETPIGLVCLSNIDNINLKAEFSIAFQRGLGTRCVTETMSVLFYYAFFTLKFNKLYFYVTSDNHSVLKMVKRYNIIQEGRLQKEMLSDTGEWLDMYRFCILREDWEQSTLCKRLNNITGALA
jgi:RimJ/RimL family protein N-acetyltransferase